MNMKLLPAALALAAAAMMAASCGYDSDPLDVQKREVVLAAERQGFQSISPYPSDMSGDGMSAALYVVVPGDKTALIQARRVDGMWLFGCNDVSGKLVPFTDPAAGKTLRISFKNYGGCPVPFTPDDGVVQPRPYATINADG